ncbi:MAG: DUF4355 domain-containing protein [Bacilli bacterium]|nr:DUF4355 domain-containing protein [Bacilli bacterium]
MNANNNAGVVENNNQQNQNTGTDVQVPKTFDEMLKESNYQSEFDKKVQKSLDTAKAKWEAEQLAKQSEAEKLAKMKEDDRTAYEIEKARKEKEDALAKLNAYELKDEAIKMANAPETQVDVSLLDLINFETIKAEQVEPTIKNIKTVFDKAVENEVNKRLKETTPKTVLESNNTSTKNISRASY